MAWSQSPCGIQRASGAITTAPAPSAIACAPLSSIATSPVPLVPWKSSTSGGAAPRERGAYTVISRSMPATRSRARARCALATRLPP